jgi:hypothetical protein
MSNTLNKLEVFQYDKNGIEIRRDNASVAFISRNFGGKLVVRPGMYRTNISFEDFEEILALKKSLARKLLK